MIKYQKPVNLNGAELVAELTAVGIKINIENSPSIDGEGNLWLDIAEIDKTKAAGIVAKHNGKTIAPELTIEEKLSSVGLSLDELKSALSL
jgi:hypothetical protein